MMTNDHPRGGGHPWDRLQDFDNFDEGDLPKDGDQHMDGDPPGDGGHLQDFYHPKGWLLNFGSIETQVSTRNKSEQSVSFSVCLSVCEFMDH